MISAKQIKAARVFLGWEQRDLAQHSGLSLPTIQRMEKLGVERSTAGNADRVQKAMEAAGVEFIPENGGGAGVRLKAPPVWEIWKEKSGSRFTAQPMSGQAPANFPSFDTPQEMREWLSKHGYVQHGNNPDIWKLA